MNYELIESMPVNSLRRNIAEFMIDNKEHITDKKVFEIGSAIPDLRCWWADNKQLFGKEAMAWVATDFQEAPNLDMVWDAEKNIPCLTYKDSKYSDFNEFYDTIVAIETFEHVYNYAEALTNVTKLLKEGGTILITVPFGHPVHNFPYDYFRYTPEAWRRILTEHGYKDIEIVEKNFKSITIQQYDSRTEVFSFPVQMMVKATKAEVTYDSY